MPSTLISVDQLEHKRIHLLPNLSFTKYTDCLLHVRTKARLFLKSTNTSEWEGKIIKQKWTEPADEVVEWHPTPLLQTPGVSWDMMSPVVGD